MHLARLVSRLFRLQTSYCKKVKRMHSISISVDKINVRKTKYVEALLYGKLLGALLTMPLYDCIDQSMLNTQGRGVSIQRFYTLLVVDLYQFYTKEKITLHTYEVFAALLQRIAKQALIEKRLRQTTYSNRFFKSEMIISEYHMRNGKKSLVERKAEALRCQRNMRR